MASLFNSKLKTKPQTRSDMISENNPENTKSSVHSDQFQDAEEAGILEINNSESSSDSGMFTGPDSSSSVTGFEENSLVDDQDGLLTLEFSGTLTFTENTPSPMDAKEFMPELAGDETATDPRDITFEVISAEVVKDGRSGHVDYSILINPHRNFTKRSSTIIKRRYSDFESLHQALKKKFPSILSQISFPRKVLVGNFSSETIAKRSTAFEQYLTHLHSLFDVRFSRDFMEFFVQDDLRAAIQFFVEENFRDSVPLLEKIVPIFEKLYGNYHILVCQCLCGLVVCHIQMDKLSTAHSCAQIALKCCLAQRSAADFELQYAILSTAIRLCWKIGVDKRDLEIKLQSLERQAIEVKGDTIKDLKEVLTKTFQTCIPK